MRMRDDNFQFFYEAVMIMYAGQTVLGEVNVDVKEIRICFGTALPVFTICL